MAENVWGDPVCPVCGSETVPANGPKSSEILLVGEFPGDEEVMQGIPMCGRMGAVFKSELSHIGIDLKSVRRMNLWQHAKITSNKPPFIYDENGDEITCLGVGLREVMKEATGRKAVLLIGSDTVKTLTGLSVSAVNGLRVSSKYISCPFIMAMVNPAIVFHEGVGELRFALRRFAEAIEGL